MKKLTIVLLVLGLLILMVTISILSDNFAKYNKLNQDNEKLACEGSTFYDSINNRRCCIGDTDAGTSQCVRNWIKP